MIARYSPTEVSKVYNLFSLLPSSCYFYPSFIDERKNIYGIGILDDNPDQNKEYVMRRFPSEFMTFCSPYSFIFKTSLFFYFEPIVSYILKPFILKDESIFFSVDTPLMVMPGWEVTAQSLVKGEREPIDLYTNSFNPLKHFVILDEKLKNKAKGSLIAAIDQGFPYLGRFPSDVEDACKDFSIANKELIAKVSEVLVRSLKYQNLFVPSTNSLILFIENLQNRDQILSIEDIPHVHIQSIDVHFIFELKEGSPKRLLRRIRRFERRFALGDLSIRTQKLKKEKPSAEEEALEYGRVRVMVKSVFPSNCYLSIHEIHNYLRELESLVVEEALPRTDSWSKSRFDERKLKEYWIRSCELVVDIPCIFESQAKEVIIEHFSENIEMSSEGKWIEKSALDENTIRLSFKIRLQPFGDYSGTGREMGVFFLAPTDLDHWTASGVECILKKDFENADIFLKKAARAIQADFLLMKNQSTLPNDKRRIAEEVQKLYRDVGIEIDGPLDEPFYLKGYSLFDIMKAQEQNSDWRISLHLYRKAFEIKKNLLLSKPVNSKYYNMSPRRLANLCLRNSGLFLVQDNVLFMDSLSSFFTDLLHEIQKKYHDLTIEWLGFTG